MVPNMNICTYVSSISMDPKLLMVALYKGTKTLENVAATKEGLLQLLGEKHAGAVAICGKQSGHNLKKLERLKKRFSFAEVEGLHYFDDTPAIAKLTFINLIEVEGDHVLGVCRVDWSKNLFDVPLLTTDFLKGKRLIR